MGSFPARLRQLKLRRDVMTRQADAAAAAGTLALALLLAQVMLARAVLPWFAAVALGAALLLELREKRSANQLLAESGRPR